MDEVATICSPRRRATPTRPLLGITVLLVEDSRYASEAMRLMCLASGARLRRADSLAAARRHLTIYRPTAAIVDLGLPDGTGADLIEDLDRADPRVPILLGLSGDLSGEAVSIAAGADGFLLKPLTRLAEFQSAILSHMPPESQPCGPRSLPDDQIHPDPLALEDDFDHVRALLSDGSDPDMRGYCAQFLAGVAKAAEESTLLSAAKTLASTRSDADVAAVVRMLDRRARSRPAI